MIFCGDRIGADAWQQKKTRLTSAAVPAAGSSGHAAPTKKTAAGAFLQLLPTLLPPKGNNYLRERKHFLANKETFYRGSETYCGKR